ncbi:hypothetical protein BRDID11004_59620 [Bradyrhizobium diazoefficiens]|uniref:Uncharacterized protein n=1 Tax=Bradyrhizobium diazoefficiens TaxID=1355477 RepID=A0A809ZSH3_9BRAD|nr:hypothetical protein [Bradyrhizobium diazoefficiens]BBZ93139.1 hypothetical protein F07S3_29720 [Bradyrhizobium diazoefficiens]BCA10890.1 hypothetical protein BDHF08_27370 [Bradyrhizobium diazoefficiens]BCE55225.1 hypothetical protein XF5B_27370 [Bradyrhizobium diazoefficiens]BCE63959.1 hypothetical protein XF6B_27580 [Bradyrhizobium diazoefficiens]
MPELNQRIRHLELPERMQRLPIDDRGFPVPYFVPWIDGKPEFRGFDGEKMVICVRHRRCWLCGEPLGKFMVFVIGPMCAVNRVSAEPPSHRECALYAVQACPFLTQPKMRRNEKDMPEHLEPAGLMLRRNPGCTLMWTTLKYSIFKDGRGGALFNVGDPERVEFFAEGRAATREEVMASIDSGMPTLREMAERDGPDAVAELGQQYSKAMELVP